MALCGRRVLNTGGAGRHHLISRQHEREPAMAFQRVLLMEVGDRCLLPLFLPVIARNPGFVGDGLMVSGRKLDVGDRKSALRKLAPSGSMIRLEWQAPHFSANLLAYEQGRIAPVVRVQS
jgi:hypothetical protein